MSADVAKRSESLARLVEETLQMLDRDGERLEALRTDVRSAEEKVTELRQQADRIESGMRAGRKTLEGIHAQLGELEVARATEESGLAHLAQSCADALQQTLDEVVAEVQAADRSADLQAGPDAEEDSDDVEEGADATPEPAMAASAGPEEHISRLRQKIDRLGPVNMMAIDQFDELSTRHQFLTTQKKDLTDSIASTQDTIPAKPDSARRLSRSKRISREPSARCSAAATPRSRCSTRVTCSRAGSRSSRRPPASGCKAFSCSRAAKRR
jgi:chromosome segregation protein